MNTQSRGELKRHSRTWASTALLAVVVPDRVIAATVLIASASCADRLDADARYDVASESRASSRGSASSVIVERTRRELEAALLSGRPQALARGLL
jgi:hypothetical protein